MVVNLSVEQETKLLAEYHQRQTLRETENAALDAERKAQQDVIKAKVEAQRLGEYHTATQDYTCTICGHTIGKGTRYRAKSIITGYGFPEGAHRSTQRMHLCCSQGEVNKP